MLERPRVLEMFWIFASDNCVWVDTHVGCPLFWALKHSQAVKMKLDQMFVFKMIMTSLFRIPSDLGHFNSLLPLFSFACCWDTNLLCLERVGFQLSQSFFLKSGRKMYCLYTINKVTLLSTMQHTEGDFKKSRKSWKDSFFGSDKGLYRANVPLFFLSLECIKRCISFLLLM